jgi:predicted dithiol-disulfide oxidoreductase (DUF899 family)
MGKTAQKGVIMKKNRVLPRDQWIEARKKLLQKEKEFTKLRDELT